MPCYRLGLSNPWSGPAHRCHGRCYNMSVDRGDDHIHCHHPIPAALPATLVQQWREKRSTYFGERDLTEAELAEFKHLLVRKALVLA